MARDIVKGSEMMEKMKAIDKLFSELPSKERYEYVEKMYGKYHTVSDVYNLKLNEEQKDMCRKIFELCPKCNCIPIAKETQCEDCELEVDFEEVADVYDYLSDSEYVVPFFDEEMTKKAYLEMVDTYKSLIASLGLLGGMIDGADRCYDCHISAYVVSKESLSVRFLEDINR